MPKTTDNSTDTSTEGTASEQKDATTIAVAKDSDAAGAATEGAGLQTVTPGGPTQTAADADISQAPNKEAAEFNKEQGAGFPDNLVAPVQEAASPTQIARETEKHGVVDSNGYSVNE